jgi:exopolysaccharide biosynthesis polyprenyl glycosylphosphotransferase
VIARSVIRFRAFLYLIVDLLCLNLAFALAIAVLFDGSLTASNRHALMNVLPSLNVLYLVLLWGFGLYSSTWKSTSELFSSIVITSILTSVSAMALAFFLRGFALPRSIVLVAFIFQLLLLSLWRFGLKRLEERNASPKRVLVIGNSQSVLELTTHFLRLGQNYQILELVKPLDQQRIEELLPKADIVCLDSQLTGEEKKNFLRKSIEENKQVLMIPALEDILLMGAQLDRIDDRPILRLDSFRLTPRQQVVKRIFDLALSSVLLLLLTPLFVLIAVLVKLTSPGPVFYVQERLGEGGVPFKLLKFRSMVVDAEEHTGPVLAQAEDPRITKVGKLLRALRLDELPQLVNIFFGQMSFVGPRPERQFFVEQFEETLPEYRYRMLVKPGLTGLAQVLGKYTTEVDDKLRYDLFYIRSYSLLLDLQILLLTLRVIVCPNSSKGTEEMANSIFQSRV